MQTAACREVDPELFYPEAGQIGQNRAAKRICANCPVKDACLAHALKTREPFGIWGGKSVVERRRVTA
jgi:WhiB family redox-sensing transcriptional regulator